MAKLFRNINSKRVGELTGEGNGGVGPDGQIRHEFKYHDGTIHFVTDNDLTRFFEPLVEEVEVEVDIEESKATTPIDAIKPKSNRGRRKSTKIYRLTHIGNSSLEIEPTGEVIEGTLKEVAEKFNCSTTVIYRRYLEFDKIFKKEWQIEVIES